MTAPTAPAAGETGEITVHRCTVTVVRRGGWSWGPDPRGLVRQVIDTLPELLADHFAAHLDGDGPDLEITEPVTVTVRPGGPGWPGADRAPAEAYFAPVATVELPGEEQAQAWSFPDSFADSFAAEAAPWEAPSAAALFGELAERGELDALLTLLPPGSLRLCALALLDADEMTAARLLVELCRHAGPDRLAEVLPERLLAEAEAEAGARAGAGGAGAQALPEPVAEYLRSAGREETARLVRALADPDEPAAGEPASPAHGAALVRTTGEVHVTSALPFLLAGPLARIGYLDAIGPALAAAELAEDAPLFAAALAYKVLGVTARGWRRGEQDSEAAAAFAGLEPPVAEERLAAFARVVRPALPVLDGVLALSVCRGHDPADPLLLTGADDGLLLVDGQGMFPIAWAADVAALLPHWPSCGRPPVLVCGGPLPPGSLRELDAAGVPFLTGVRPLRGDPVERLPWRTPLWTGTAKRLPDPRIAAELPGHADRLAGLVTALVTERRAVPLAPDGGPGDVRWVGVATPRRPVGHPLERTVTLAAALGLSTIAWTLWRDHETPDPLLALRRFADLEATVRFEPAAVRVRVPMGRRHADLLRGGLLADVPDVVWLGGRTLTFSGG